MLEADKHCIVCLEKIKQIEKKLRKPPSWPGYAEWIIKLLMATSELPENTSTLFQLPLEPHLKRLFIKCLITTYSRGETGIAAALCNLLLSSENSLKLSFPSKYMPNFYMYLAQQ